MNTKSKEKIKTLSLMEAVETLSSIADLKLENEALVAEKHAQLSVGEKIPSRTIHWLRDLETARTLKVVKEIFKVILSHLNETWEHEFQLVKPREKIESIKSIMILVGEAAKRLDRYKELFNDSKEKSVTELKEYIALKKFYQSKISRIVDEGILSKWLFTLTKGFIGKQTAPLKGEEPLALHIFIDLEQIKNDSSYELLFIRKEDGSRFFNPRLIRNMKLVIDFGGSLQSSEEDSLLHREVWHDKIANYSAKMILKSLGSRLDIFFKEIAKHRTKLLPQKVSSALMALFMAACPENLNKRFNVKTCIDYLMDFEEYMHEALTSVEYQKMVAYPPKSTNHLAEVLFDTIHAIIRAFFLHFDEFHEIVPKIHEMIQEAITLSLNKENPNEPLSKRLENLHENTRKLVRSAIYGPMMRNLEMIENWETHFSPLLQKNWPTQLFSIYTGSTKILCLKLPSPTIQEYIHKAHVLEEFIAFLRASKNFANFKRHLLFNLQDRTSWKEIARCKALETLPENGEFDPLFAIATFPFETDFYHQLSPYDQDKQFNSFEEHFIEQLSDENTGFYLQKNMVGVLKANFLKELFDAVNKVFFHGKNVLTREQRLDFISIAYLMLFLKCIEVNRPDSISFTCKDALDIGMSQSALVWFFFKMMKEDRLKEEEVFDLCNILFAPQLLIRERPMLQERFLRLSSAIHTLELAKNEYGKEHFKVIIHEVFGHLISKEILESQIVTKEH